MLERDQTWVHPEAINEDVQALGPEFPDLIDVHEIWIADAATFEPTKECVEFVVAVRTP